MRFDVLEQLQLAHIGSCLAGFSECLSKNSSIPYYLAVTSYENRFILDTLTRVHHVNRKLQVGLCSKSVVIGSVNHLKLSRALLFAWYSGQRNAAHLKLQKRAHFHSFDEVKVPTRFRLRDEMEELDSKVLGTRAQPIKTLIQTLALLEDSMYIYIHYTQLLTPGESAEQLR